MMIPVTVTYETETGETATTYEVDAINVWSAMSLARMQYTKEHPRARVLSVLAVGPKI